MSDTIISKAPTRADIIGGTLDIWPVSAVLPMAATINVGIPLFAGTRLTLRTDRQITIQSLDQHKVIRGGWEQLTRDSAGNTSELPLASLILGAFWNPDLPGFDAQISAECPGGAGLGGSSCLAITFASALAHAAQAIGGTPIPGEDALVRWVSSLESRLIHGPVGTQDHWGALRGGVNVITYPGGSPSVKTIRHDLFQDSSWSMILCYSGTSRFSGMNNWELFRRFFEKDPVVVGKFEQIASLSHQALPAVLDNDVETLVELSEQEWQIRRTFASGIETEETRQADHISRQAGARFSRVCGAGGGGMMIMFARKERESTVRHALSGAGFTLYPAGLCLTGLQVSVT